ncbi:MAG: hypothetical protein RI959_762 [Pseudomonadota bacterium]|jgi:Ni/Co efflux regulator RcnB
MKPTISALAASVIFALTSFATPVSAEKPEGVGNGKKKWEQEGKPSKHQQANGSAAASVSVGVFFGDAQRREASRYFAPQVAAGKCPPGLAKKGNGCLPPGQAKKWAVGQRLPADVVTYPIPAELRIKLGVPPAGHDFVRVAGDILLIAVGTSMVIDAIEDLTR